MSQNTPPPEADLPPMPTPEEPAATELTPPDAAAAPADGEVIGASTPGQSEGAIKDPEDWVTGDEPMTDSQRSYLDTLAKQAGEQLPADLTKAQASEHIDRLQAKTGRGRQS